MDKIKVIFLDIDGVMNSRESAMQDLANGIRPYSTFTKSAIDGLNRILTEVPDSVIVISSVWRIIHTLLELQRIFESFGIDRTRIVDVTPRSRKDEVRGDEIQSWLDNHGQNVSSFVIIDDDSDMAHLLPHLVRTKCSEGMSMVHAVDAIKHLNG